MGMRGFSRVFVYLACVAAWLGVVTADTEAAFPGSNGLIAFQSNRDDPGIGQHDVYVMNPDGSDPRRLTTAGGEYPAWSPDGKQIAFARGKNEASEIWVMNADGSGQKRVTDRPAATDTSPAWSPDGTMIAFASSIICCGAGTNWDIWVINADGSGERNITNHPAQDLWPSWQPGGGRIAFQTLRDGNLDIYAVNADGTGLHNLSNSPETHEWEPDWSPNGRQLAVVARPVDTGRPQPTVWIMDADGGNRRQLTGGRQDMTPAWAPDGTKILYVRGCDEANCAILVISADGGDPTILDFNVAMDRFPDWQPLINAGDETPPVLTVPSDITVNATSSAGTTVTFTATATDDADPAPTVTCTPASGNIFPIGTTVVACTATDAAGNSAAASFDVHVKGAQAQLQDLINLVTSQSLGPGRSFRAKLQAALKALTKHDEATACGSLRAFLNQVRAQSGKSITAAQATQLGLAAMRVRSVIGC